MTKLIKTAAFLALVAAAPAAYAAGASDPADNAIVRSQTLDVARGGYAAEAPRGVVTFAPGAFGETNASAAPATSGVDSAR